jgi:lactate dehydrogenase-like 2-hydroxyacid dehydrogenase
MAEKPVVFVTRKLPDAVEERLKRDYEAILNPDDKLYTADELVEISTRADAILPCHTEKLTAEVIGRLSERVKAIANFSVGYDHVDVASAKARGLIVTNTPDVLSDATAEIAILCMLGAARRATEGIALVREGEWRDWSPAFMVGRQTTGKRFGVVGMGRVGQVAAQRARGFDMEIHYTKRSRLDGETEAALGATYHASLEDLLPLCDVLSLHCPATPETSGLLNAERLALLPEGAIVVNTARGALIDDEALVAALESGQVAAAGLDVFNGEPADIHPAYRRLPNVFALPHIGSATAETRDAMGFRALDNLDAVFAGREPRDRVA